MDVRMSALDCILQGLSLFRILQYKPWEHTISSSNSLACSKFFGGNPALTTFPKLLESMWLMFVVTCVQSTYSTSMAQFSNVIFDVNVESTQVIVMLCKLLDGYTGKCCPVRI